MTPLKSPLLSLGAKGTIGDALTYQERQGYSFAREKPIPTNPRSLPQIYQRWLYEDYAYRWTQQSAATRAEYRAGGVRFHLTGFQYWMKVTLTTWPDIVAWWRLDHQVGALYLDSSPNNLNATIFGTTSIPGRIDQGAYFDGINDQLNCGFNPLLLDYTDFTFIVFGRCDIQTWELCLFSTREAAGLMYGFEVFIIPNVGRIHFHIDNVAGGQGFGSTSLFADGNIHCLAVRRIGAACDLFFDGTLENSMVKGGIINSVGPFIIGNRIGKTFWYKDLIDNFMLFNRGIETELIQRWAQRRYPLQ